MESFPLVLNPVLPFSLSCVRPSLLLKDSPCHVMFTIERLPTCISYLEPNGANGAIFAMCFKDAMKVARWWVCFTAEAQLHCTELFKVRPENATTITPEPVCAPQESELFSSHSKY